MTQFGRLWFLIGTVIAIAVGIVHPPAFGYIEFFALLGGVVWLIGRVNLRKHKV
jgi:hypothetical protein